MSAHQYEDMYDELGIDLKTLGCVMLGTETPDTSFIEDEDLYVANDPKLFWVNGRVQDSHLTLKYGLLPQVRRKHVDRVLDGAEIPAEVFVDEIIKFDSPYPDEPYDCIVGSVSLSNSIVDTHNRLNYLPHINTFPDYKPHVTLAYVRKGWYDEHVDVLGDRRLVLNTTALDYGRMQ